MISKTTLLVLVLAVAYAAGNPAVGVKSRKPSRHATVTPNVMGLPWKELAQTYVPKVRIPGYKKVENCGPVMKNNERIVGGSESVPNSHPWMAAILFNNAFFCAGVLISDEWIMTVAQCASGAIITEVTLGAHNINNYESSQVTVYATKFIINEEYDPSILTNDMALIHLSAPVSLTAEIQPICLPAYSTADLQEGDMATVSGWGTLSENDAYISDFLSEVTVPVMTNAECKLSYGPSVTDNTICIDTIGGKGLCAGDAGGALEYVDQGCTIAHGLGSYGSSAGCESGYPNAFTRVSGFLEWIEYNTGIIIDA